MKTLMIAALAAFSAFAQTNSLRQTSLSAAVSVGASTITVASATNIVGTTVSVAGTQLWVVERGQNIGEVMTVLSVSGTTLTVQRTASARVAHASGAVVLHGNPEWFYKYNPTGTCTASTVYVSPWLNTLTGEQWLCSSQTGGWVAGWGNRSGTAQLLTATATASVAGATAIAGPLVEISGTEAITSFTMSTGWNGHGFCVQPTAAFTTVAGNNIAEASTADANQTLCFVWNARAAAFTASY